MVGRAYDPAKPQFRVWLPGYLFIFVGLSSLKLSSKSRVRGDRATLRFLLIFLANRFNSPYYRWLNTGIGPVVRPVKQVVVVVDGCSVVETRQIIGLQKFAQRRNPPVRTEESFPFLEYFLRTGRRNRKFYRPF